MKQATMLRLVLGSASLIGVAMSGTSVIAQTTADLLVQANVGGECTVSGNTLDFGTYSGDQLNIAVPISYNCNAPANISISLDGGDNGEPGNRQMFNTTTGQSLLYDLFQDENRSDLWGVFPVDSVDINPTEVGDTDVTVFGRVFAGQAPLPGIYSDTVTITLTTN